MLRSWALTMIERFLFRKIELWVVVLLLILGILASIWFGWRVSKIPDRLVLGNLDRLVRGTADLPETALELYSSLTEPSHDSLLAKEQRFEGESGFEFNYGPGQRPDLDYVLVNRYDGDAGRSVSELVDLNSQEVVHRWWFDVDAIWSKMDFDSSILTLAADYSTDRFRNNAFLLRDGSVIVQHSTPLLRFDHCGRLIWAQDVDLFHHSIERDQDGNFWIPTTIEPKTVTLGGWDFRDDGITKVSPTGEVLFSKSVVQMLDENGLAMYAYGRGFANPDPIHLNDIEPVLQDGVIWRKGDLFLSVRHLSMVLLYRPSTSEVIWYRVGPWLHQHDIDLIDDRHISVFDNQGRTKYNYVQVVLDTNDLIVFDVVTGEVTRPFSGAFEKLDVRTPIEGLAQAVGQNELMIEETSFGRLLQFDRSGNVTWQFVNRAHNGNVYILAWSRLVPRELGDAVRRKVAQEPCRKNSAPGNHG
jgi:hypothetical protein